MAVAVKDRQLRSARALTSYRISARLKRGREASHPGGNEDGFGDRLMSSAEDEQAPSVTKVWHHGSRSIGNQQRVN
ncbi:hypothetical protein BC1002_3524 [Paraburkholderia atlantica]|uniref:Uncharacterized protein n=1 Tax=Paraburkholderia atlantica TaxID=2654982 RepID=D5WGD5_PARAM|nr:hypothetical protein [Paraburkholderia atlantica]ADG17554.1 hypothetical protein BC1002_3524 [Paraburkholderia atlantica]